MRTVLLGNNDLGGRVARYLFERDELLGAVVHPPARRKAADAFGQLGVPMWEWPDGRDGVAALNPECLLSVLFGYLIPRDWLTLASWQALNLHPGLLPFNQGAAPNVWPLVDGSPAGTTLHAMDERIDTGPIMAQQQVPTYPDDTGESLYRRLEEASFALFTSVWPGVRDLPLRPQEGKGTHHRMSDLASLDLTDDDLAVLDKLRARTFSPHGAEFVRGGRRFQTRVEIEPLDP